MNMTYRELLTKLKWFTPEQLDMNVSVAVGDEFYPVEQIQFTEETDILDKGHPCLVIQ